MKRTMDSSLTMTKQGVRNLNSRGPQKKPLRVVELEPGTHNGQVVSARHQVPHDPSGSSPAQIASVPPLT
jgi:hypothetical protein